LGLSTPLSKGRRMMGICGEGNTGLVLNVFFIYEYGQKTGIITVKWTVAVMYAD
jgi:hypothetical protein